jgi:hypothetical protein
VRHRPTALHEVTWVFGQNVTALKEYHRDQKRAECVCLQHNGQYSTSTGCRRITHWRCAENTPKSKKGTVIPTTRHWRAQKEQSYSSTLSLTPVLGAGGWLTPRPDRKPPKKDPVPTV